jgi:hypothetical protein
MSTQALERTVHLGFTEGRFSSATHMCLIYSDEQERRDLLSGFVASAVDDGDRVSYAADVWELDQLRDYLQEKTGVAVRGLEAAGQCEFYKAASVYCPDGTFSPESMWEKLADQYLRARADGFPGIRVTGEMSWSLNDVPGAERLVEYEAGINPLVEKYPLTVICQYDASRFDGETLFNILRVHPYMIARRQIVANPYYEKT